MLLLRETQRCWAASLPSLWDAPVLPASCSQEAEYSPWCRSHLHFPQWKTVGSGINGVVPCILCTQMPLGTLESWEQESVGMHQTRRGWISGQGRIWFDSKYREDIEAAREKASRRFRWGSLQWRPHLVLILNEGNSSLLSKLFYFMVNVNAHILLRISQGLNTFYRMECPGRETQEVYTWCLSRYLIIMEHSRFLCTWLIVMVLSVECHGHLFQDR